MFTPLPVLMHTCDLKALGDFDSSLQKHSPLRFARLLQGQLQNKLICCRSLIRRTSTCGLQVGQRWTYSSSSLSSLCGTSSYSLGKNVKLDQTTTAQGDGKDLKEEMH